MTTPTVPAGSVVVGTDGSTWSDEALLWAADQAHLEHRPLTIVYSGRLDTGGGLIATGQFGIEYDGLYEAVRVSGLALLDAARLRVLDRYADLEVHVVLSALDARDVLLDLGREAALVVVGSRGRGAVKTLLLGSVSVAVSKHAPCPVAVVRHPDGAERRGGVLVGIDGTAESLPAIELAFRMASLHAWPLTALHVYYDAAYLSEVSGADDPVPADEVGVDDERLLMSESLAGMREKFPEVEERSLLMRGFRDQQIVRASHDMDLVVVGSRRRGFFEDLLHGSVAPSVVEHATCNVVVVPAESRPAR
jgi:nucleotide-binding universal stress UspA family protein